MPTSSASGSPSPDDPNLTKRVAAGGNVTVYEENAVFVQADENGKFDLTMNYATIPETGWTQRDWEGMTYAWVEGVESPLRRRDLRQDEVHCDRDA